jgi:hypothetical protein
MKDVKKELQEFLLNLFPILLPANQLIWAMKNFETLTGLVLDAIKNKPIEQLLMTDQNLIWEKEHISDAAKLVASAIQIPCNLWFFNN